VGKTLQNGSYSAALRGFRKSQFIVITKSSSLDPLFFGLPVVIVKDWNEVRQKSNFAEWLRQYGGLTHRDRIWRRLDPDRYLQPIRHAVDAANASPRGEDA
jgi:hypothetical protein